jgi:hypothetical protein
VPIELVSRPFVTDPNKPFPAVICPPNTQDDCSPAPPDRRSQYEVSPERLSLCE